MSLVLFLAGSAVAAPLTFVDETSARVNTVTMQNGQLDKEYAIGDIDRDGDLDVVLAIAEGIFGRKQNLVYRNDGGVLNDISLQAVPEFWHDTLSRRPFLEDLDGDGWLDLIVVNDTLASGYAGETHLWMSNNATGTFLGFVQEDARLNGGGGASCGAAMEDYDLDGDVDLYVGNYPGPSQDTMYLNDGNGFYTDVTASFVPTDSDYTTDVVHADFNGDGTLDISVGNHGDNSFVYYNNLLGQSVDGDFSTPNSTQVTVTRTRYHNATEPIDADGDGDVDLYMANYRQYRDALLLNQGTVNGVVQWRPTAVPGVASTQETTKPTTVDLNDDGRMDLILPAEDGRPVILRNTTVAGSNPTWVDWTPPAIVDGSAHEAFSVAVFDVDGDTVHDIVIFGHEGEHVLTGGLADTYDADALAGVLPDTSAGPIVVEGRAGLGERIVLVSPGAISGDRMSAVVRSCGDVGMRAAAANGVSRWSNRGLHGIEEAAEIEGLGGRAGVAVNVIGACGDSDGDGDVDNDDLRAAAQCVASPTPACVGMFDVDLDGRLTPADQALLLADMGSTPMTRFTLEVLTR